MKGANLDTTGDSTVTTLAEYGGLVTPNGSPKTSTKRPAAADEMSPVRRLPKRRAATKMAKYEDPGSEVEDDADEMVGKRYRRGEDGSDDEDDEWKPVGEALEEGVGSADARVTEEVTEASKAMQESISM